MNTETALARIREFYKAHHRVPSYQEMCALFGFSSKKASFDLAKKLIDLGILEKDSRGKLMPKRLFPPLPFYGSIQAGYPTPAEEQLMNTMSFDSYLVDRPEMSFVLKVNGDSMIEAGINEGDLVIIEKGRTPKKGDVVVALVDNEWTLKYYESRDGKVCLVPANKKYPIIYPRESLEIWGVVISIVRRYN